MGSLYPNVNDLELQIPNYQPLQENVENQENIEQTNNRCRKLGFFVIFLIIIVGMLLLMGVSSNYDESVPNNINTMKELANWENMHSIRYQKKLENFIMFESMCLFHYRYKYSNGKYDILNIESNCSKIGSYVLYGTIFICGLISICSYFREKNID